MKKLALIGVVIGVLMIGLVIHFALKGYLLGKEAFFVLILAGSLYAGGIVVYFKKLYLE